MGEKLQNDVFFNGFSLAKDDIVAIVGAGGKTSLMFKLAEEAANHGMRVLVTTSTKIYVPQPHQYTALDMTGELFAQTKISEPGIYVGGILMSGTNKLAGVSFTLLKQRLQAFDLILIEADGAAEKSLKGWKNSEPVIPSFATKTIGVLDIQVVGAEVSEKLVHRLEIFSQLTEAAKGDLISLPHLAKLIAHPNGLFGKAIGRKILFLNKAESPGQRDHARKLAQMLQCLTILYGSLQKNYLVNSAKHDPVAMSSLDRR